MVANGVASMIAKANVIVLQHNMAGLHRDFDHQRTPTGNWTFDKNQRSANGTNEWATQNFTARRHRSDATDPIRPRPRISGHSAPASGSAATGPECEGAWRAPDRQHRWRAIRSHE